MDRKQLTQTDRNRLVRRTRGGIVELGRLVDWNIAYVYVRFFWGRYPIAVCDFDVEFADCLEDPFRLSIWSTDELARQRYSSFLRSSQ